MVLNLQDKQNIVTKINEIAKKSSSAVIADFRGIKANKMTELRKASREVGVHIIVIRNTLMRRMVKDTPYECLKDKFVGPTLIAFSKENPGAAALLFKTFAKDNINFKIKFAAFNGKIISASRIDYLANLPTYEKAIINLIMITKEASAGKLVRILNIISNQKKHHN